MTKTKPPVYSFSDIILSKNEDDKEREYEIVSSVDELPEDPKPGSRHYIQFSMFRTGNWEHPWYGPIDFDREYLESLVNNFNAGVVPRKIGFDLEHSTQQGDTGNVAWMKELLLRDGKVKTPVGELDVTFLDVVAELNSAGTRLLKDRRYAHCSAEIHGDFTTNEKIPIKVDGEDATTVMKHGPTITGCGFTNKPFIPSLGEVIEFSEGEKDTDNVSEFTMSSGDDTGIRFFSYRKRDEEEILKDSKDSADNKGFTEPSEPAEPDTATFSEPESEPEVETGQDEGPSFTSILQNDFTNQKRTETYSEDHMNLQELKAKLKTFSTAGERVEYLKGVQKDFSDGEAVVVESLIEVQEFAAQTERDTKAQVDEAMRVKRLAEEQAETYSTQKRELELKLSQAQEGAWGERVKRFGAELRAQGHHESMVKVAIEKLDGMNVESRKNKFSFGTGEDKQEEGLIDILSACFEALPEAARLDQSEKTNANQEFEETVVNPDKPAEDAAADAEDDSEDGVDEAQKARLEAYSSNHDGAECPEFYREYLNDDGSINFASYDTARKQ